MLMIVFGAGCLLLSVLFHAASLLHLGLPLLYALIVPTLFSGWYYSHYALANGIWYALIVLGLISCIVSLVQTEVQLPPAGRIRAAHPAVQRRPVRWRTN